MASAHLLLPLLASILFTFGLIFIKRASAFGATSWMVVVVANSWAALIFSSLWFGESRPIPWPLFWQPVLAGALYFGGQTFTFLALDRGDVSVASPVLSLKIVVVAILLPFVTGQPLSWARWMAVLMAVMGIVLVQRSDRSSSHHARLLWSIGFGLLAACTFAAFDVVVQHWASKWGSGHFLPVAFAAAWLMSLFYLFWIDAQNWRAPGMYRPLIGGTLLIALQAMCIVCTLAYFGDAVNVNVVYALRGLWSVVFAFLLANRLQMGERHLSRATMHSRIFGAGLLTLAVLIALMN